MQIHEARAGQSVACLRMVMAEDDFEKMERLYAVIAESKSSSAASSFSGESAAWGLTGTYRIRGTNHYYLDLSPQ